MQTVSGPLALSVPHYLLCPVVEWSIAISLSVCVSVCVHVSAREHILRTTGPIFANFFVRISCGHGSVLLRRRCDTLCTSGFMDDVTFGRSGLYGDAWYRVEYDVYECLVSTVRKWVYQSVQHHIGLTHLFNFLTFGHWRSVLSTRVPECQTIISKYGPEV